MRKLTAESIITSILIALSMSFMILSAMSRDYISPGVISLVPWDSVMICGPIAAAGAALAAVWRCANGSPVTGASVLRIDGRQAAREMLRFTFPILVVFVGVSIVLVPVVSGRADGGTVDWIRVFTGLIAFFPFPILGFLVGIAFQGLWSVFVAIFTAIILMYAPLFIMELLRPNDELIPLTAPALFGAYAGYDSPLGKPTLMWYVLFGAWLLIGFALAFLAVGIQRARSGYGVFTAIVSGGLAFGLLFAAFAWAGLTEPVLAKEYVAAEYSCVEANSGSQVCVAEEEKSQLFKAVEAVNLVESRMGIEQSDKTISSYLLGSDSKDVHFTLPFDYNTPFEIASSLTGMDQCSVSKQQNLDFSFALTLWAINDEETRKKVETHTGVPEETWLFSKDVLEIQNMYKVHKQEILSCDMSLDKLTDEAD